MDLVCHNYTILFSRVTPRKQDIHSRLWIISIIIHINITSLQSHFWQLKLGWCESKVKTLIKLAHALRIFFAGIHSKNCKYLK